MNSELKNIIDRIDGLKAEVDSYRPLKPEQEQRLLQKIRLDWNYHSSHIEGNTLTFGETKALILWGITAQGKPLRDHLEIKGHNDVVDYIMDILKGKEITLNESFIREMHNIIIPEAYELDAKTPDGMLVKRKITPGEYKKMPNHVLTPTGEMFYFATPEETPAKMMDLMAWYKKECEDKENHPIVIASMFHYQFVRIHPFDDGNGRMSRILMNLILMQYGYPPAIIQTEKRVEYLNTLQYADADDYDKFIQFIGEQVIESLELWVRAAKGEHIEEYGDINKMIKIIEKKIEWGGLDEEIKSIKSVDVLEELNNTTITKLVQLFCDKLFNLNRFFEQDCIIGKYFVEAEPKSEYFKTLVQMTKPLQVPYEGERLKVEDIGNYLSKAIKLPNISEIRITYKLHRLVKDKNIQIEKSLTFSFEQNLYKIKFTDFKEIQLQRRYHQALSETEIDNTTDSIFSSCYSIIEKALNENGK